MVEGRVVRRNNGMMVGRGRSARRIKAVLSAPVAACPVLISAMSAALAVAGEDEAANVAEASSGAFEIVVDGRNIADSNETSMEDWPSSAPSVQYTIPPDVAEEVHEEDAYTALTLNVTLIICILLAYYVKVNRVYYMPESAAAMLVGVVLGGIARLALTDLTLWQFSPEFFFFVLLPPIIFEAGYSLKRKHFFDNIGAITLYAMVGTMISCFIVGYFTFFCAKIGLIKNVSSDNPMEALLFGALISAVDPVATLSIMGSPELQCDQLLYSLVFGESVLNDAIAIVLFKTFHKYYDPDTPDLSQSEIPSALLAFLSMSVLSVVVGIALGLVSSFIYKHSSLSEFPQLETSLLFLFCYFCYATAEALELSGIMALFFNGIVLSHYNSYNLSRTAHVTSEGIFATLATVMETIVFLYMGMGVFTGKFRNWDITFSILSIVFCGLGRALNIFPLSWLANLCRKRGHNHIPMKMQFVLWFAGLRGAIAFALAENMPGPNRETYASATLTICIFTTVVCGGFTEKILSEMGMKQGEVEYDDGGDDIDYGQLITASPIARRVSTTVYDGVKGIWKHIDDTYLKRLFGGPRRVELADEDDDGDLGHYELNRARGSDGSLSEEGDCEEQSGASEGLDAPASEGLDAPASEIGHLAKSD